MQEESATIKQKGQPHFSLVTAKSDLEIPKRDLINLTATDTI